MSTLTWGDVGKIVAPIAPTIGSVLGSLIPIPGAGVAGQLLGVAIAKKFGVEPTPQAVSDAIRRTEADVTIAKLNAAAEEVKSSNEMMARIFEAEAALQARSVEATNATMRVEVLPENRHWYFTGWRPACGWVLVYSFLVYGSLLFFAMGLAAFAGTPRPLEVIVAAWPAAALYFGALALVNGVNIWSRSKDKETARAPAVAVVKR